MPKPDNQIRSDVELLGEIDRLRTENGRLRRLVDDDRQKFAAAAMTQWMALNGENWRGTKMPMHVADHIAENAVTLADAMLRALAKSQ